MVFYSCLIQQPQIKCALSRGFAISGKHSTSLPRVASVFATLRRDLPWATMVPPLRGLNMGTRETRPSDIKSSRGTRLVAAVIIAAYNSCFVGRKRISFMSTSSGWLIA